MRENQRRDDNRGNRARDPKPENREGQGQGRGKPFEQRGGGRPDRDRHDGPRGDRKREERRVPMNVISSAPTKKAGAVDPDSPFAKLMALREAMGKGESGKS